MKHASCASQPAPATALEIIRAKRDGLELSAAQLRQFADGIVSHNTSDAQIAAFAMAVTLQGMTMAEKAGLTLAMCQSGQQLKWSLRDLHGPIVDKHSTGGVGDNVSLMLAPMIAACGAYVPMISGRALGHTGGTLDKLESIPDFCTALTLNRFQEVVTKVGCAIVGQSAELAPADARMYAVRDLTATIESDALIASSILSKKCAAGLQGLVLDIKCGQGAFMNTLDSAAQLANDLTHVGCAIGLRTEALITDMNQPLAPCIGNAVEVQSALDYLAGRARPARLHRVVLALGAKMLQIVGLAESEAHAHSQLQHTLDSGRALEAFARMVGAQGGPIDFVEHADNYLPCAPVVIEVGATRSGFVNAIDARRLGELLAVLGGARLKVGQPIDHAVGLSELVSIGDAVTPGHPLARIHARNESDARLASAALQASMHIADYRPNDANLIHEISVTQAGVHLLPYHCSGKVM